jgi:hypothetical protein
LRFLALALCLAIAWPCAAFAQTAPDAPPVPVQQGRAVVQQDGTVAPADEVDPNAGRPDPDAEVICRVVQESGSRLARRRQRICGTRTMWEQVEDENARNVRRSGSVQGRQD